MKNYIKQIGIGFLILSILGTVFYLFEQKNKQITALKKEAIENAVLIVENERITSKLVNDLNTEKELKRKLEKTSKELSQIIKDRKEKPVQIIETVIQMPGKNDTVRVHDTIIGEKSYMTGTFYYPSETDYFAQVDVSFSDGVGIGKFYFMPLPLNLVVTEKENGLFVAYAESYDFIDFHKVEVNSVRMKPQFPEKPYKFYLGGGVSYIDGFRFYTSGTMKWKDHMIDASLFGFSGIALGYRRPL